MKPQPHQYQTDGIKWLRDKGRCLLGDEPGLGKSRQMIEASVGRTLVVAPAMVITGGTWDEEISRWADDPSRFTVAAYSALNERVKTERGGTRPVASVKRAFMGDWDTLIVDEAHYVKGRKTSWTHAVTEIAERSERVFLATGTPIANWAPELFTLLRIIYPGQAKPGNDLGSYWRWVETWFRVTASRYNLNAREVGELRECRPECLTRPAYDPCKHYLRFMDVSLGDRFLRRVREQCLDLPPLTIQQIQTPMSDATRRTYRRLKKEYVTYVEGNPNAVVAWNNGSRNDLLDLCTVSDWFLGDPPSGDPRGGKIDRLQFDLEQRTRPTLVLAHHRAVVEACAQVGTRIGARTAYVHGGVDKVRTGRRIQDFKDGKLDVLVGSLETLAEGLTLTTADMAIFVERSYKPYRNEQARRRIHRIGQTRPVSILEYVTPNSVDSRKQMLVDTKTDRQMRFLSARDFASLL